jgi:hypothetical protein
MTWQLPTVIMQQLFLGFLFLLSFFLLFLAGFYFIKKKTVAVQHSFDKLKSYSYLKMVYPYFSVFVFLQLSNSALAGTIFGLALFGRLTVWMLAVSLAIQLGTQFICWRGKWTEKNQRKIKLQQLQAVFLLVIYFLILYCLSHYSIKHGHFAVFALGIWLLYQYSAVKLYRHSFRKKQTISKKNQSRALIGKTSITKNKTERGFVD